MPGSSGRRLQSVRQTDEAIFGALESSLSEHGIDSLTSAGVARAAGVTVGAIYSRAESLSELANLLWVDSIGDAFIRALSDVVESSRQDDAAGFDDAITRFDTRMRTASPAIELAIASLFDDELDDVVGSSLRTGFRDVIIGPGGSYSAHEAACATLILSYFCGRAITRCRVRRMRRPDPDSQRVLRGFWSAQPAEVVGAVGSEIEFLRPDGRSGEGSVGTGVDLTIERAVVDVVAQYGFRRGTIARIARRAGVTPGAVLLKGESKLELMTRAADTLLLSPREAWEVYVRRSGGVPGAAIRAAFVADLLDTRHSRFWRLNLELARLAEKRSELHRFRTPNDVLQQTHQGVMFVACFAGTVHSLPFAGPFSAGSAT